jgi:CspA family cold shock protein
MRYRGYVKWFTEDRGIGRIKVDGMDDVLVHFSELAMEGFRMLYEGDHVELEIVSRYKGNCAVNVKKI